MTPAPVIVTRPAREAQRWVEGLRAAGLDAVALPLIVVAPLEDPQPLAAARRQAGAYAVLMFVSVSAVDHFFAEPGLARRLGDARCWAPGPGTARALARAGVPVSAIDAPSDDAEQFDSEALWTVVCPQVQPGTRVLLVRGGDAAGRPGGREWLAREIAAAGGRCEAVAAYRRLPPTLDEAERRLAVDAAAGHAIWCFSSSEAIANLRAALPDTDWRAARAIATHDRIAEAAQAAGFGHVRVSRPALPDVVASIESFE